MHMQRDGRVRERLVVIGNGMAGARVVEEILKINSSLFDITMIGGEPYGNYNRILLSNVLNGSQDPKEIFLNSLEWYEKNDINLLAGVQAVSIDRQARTVLMADDRLVPYDKLILATGSQPFVPPIPGVNLQGVFVFRTLDDCAAITKYASNAQTAAVIGGGLLGLEAAKGLMTHGPAVHIVEMSPTLMSMQLDGAGGTILEKTITNLGITAHCGKSTTAIAGDEQGRVRALQFKDGSELPC